MASLYLLAAGHHTVAYHSKALVSLLSCETSIYITLEEGAA